MTSSEFQTYIFAYLPQSAQAVPAGKLTMIESGTEVQASQFGYGKRYLQRQDAYAIDPASLALQSAQDGTVQLYEPANGLTMFGAVRDAMPDAWGRRVIENKLKAQPNSLNESQYLEQAGSNRLGALDFRKTQTDNAQAGLLPDVQDLSYLVEAADKIETGEYVPEHLRQIFDAGPSMGGARPKAVITKNGMEYIAKFTAKDDAFNVPQIERATLELARLCGLDVPATEYLWLANNKPVMLIARFDRKPGLNNEQYRTHTVSGLTMLGLHESESANSSYVALADVISSSGAKGFVQQDRKELFARMVFNILVSNDDDHLRNHAFVWDDINKGWRLSPLYDVLPKPQVATERYLHLSVGKQGRLATLDNALSMAGQFGLMDKEAARITNDIAMKTREWRTFFESEMQVPTAECDKVKSAFRRPADIGLDFVEKRLK